jgi:hypothetical protein
MKKMIATLGAALMMLGLFGVSQATADPGPNGNNDKGLCTAYFNGQKRGHDKDGDGRTDNARAFQGLEEAAGVTEETAGDDVADMVYEFCMSMAGNDGDGVDIGGNPNDNGRWTCSVDDNDTPNDTSDDEYNCDPNEPKGKGNGPSKD